MATPALVLHKLPAKRWVGGGWGLGARIKMSQWVPRGGSSTISSLYYSLTHPPNVLTWHNHKVQIMIIFTSNYFIKQ